MSDRDRSQVTGFRSILCAVDFSRRSSAAAHAAADIARRNGGHMTAVWIDDPLLNSSAAAVGYDTASLRKSTLAQLRRLVQRVATETGLPADAWSVDTALGQPGPAIVAISRRMRADLIVMGTHGRRGAAKWFFGSVTNAVLQRAPAPVLVVPRDRLRDRVRGAGRGLLGAIDLGSHDRADAQRMAHVARLMGTRLTLLHVVARTSGPHWIASRFEQYDRRRLVAARARLAALAKSVGAGSRVVLGHPDEEIPAVARDTKAGLIVLTLRRGRGLLGPRQGTTTYHVLCRATVPVLALPPGS